MEDQEGLDLGKYLRILEHRKKTILLPAIMAAVAALALSLLTASNTNPVATRETTNASYTATTQALVRPANVSTQHPRGESLFVSCLKVAA